MNDEPPEVVDLHPSEWKRAGYRERFFGRNAMHFIILFVLGLIVAPIVSAVVVPVMNRLFQ